MVPKSLTRRMILAVAALAASAPRALAQGTAAPPLRRDLGFSVWRKGVQIGRHRVSFTGGPADFNVAIEAEMLVKFGPIPVFHYHHQATEVWRQGRFESLQSRTTSNGKLESVSARRTAEGVAIARGAGRPAVQAPGEAHPLTHWNMAVLQGPLFNPQTGALVHERAVRSAGEPLRLEGGREVSATRYSLSGDAQIVDWYDEADAWAALKGRAPDGSTVDYRRDA